MGVLMELQPKQHSSESKLQSPDFVHDFSTSRTMSNFSCPEPLQPDHWRPGPPMVSPHLLDRPSHLHRMSPPSSWLQSPPHPFIQAVTSLPQQGGMSPAGAPNIGKVDGDFGKMSESGRCSSPIPQSSRGLHELQPNPQGINDNSRPPICAGCRQPIMDKFYLCAVDDKWHSTCLKCSDCGMELANQQSCFERDGNIYCKDDYKRIYANNRQCAHCLMEIQTSDLVMKARHCLFHTDCFTCATCDTLLKKGDLFGMYENVLYCKAHFELVTGSVHNQKHQYPPPGPYPPGDMHGHSPISDHAYIPPHGPLHPAMGYPFIPPNPGAGPAEPPWFSGSPCPGDYGMSDVPYENNNEPFLKKRRGRKKRKVENFAVMNGYLDSGYPPGLDGQSGSGKTKRARTSFKHHQLRIMKAHFQINQNPDSRELKMLSQKTGLDKKVLQVWFQNARAKWRRTNAQSGTNPPLGSSGPNEAATDTSSSDNGMSSLQDDHCPPDSMVLGP